jgi:hypothetical protein
MDRVRLWNFTGSLRVHPGFESEKGIAPSVRLLNWLSNPEKIGGKMEITNSKRRGGDSLDLKDPIPQIKGIIL